MKWVIIWAAIMYRWRKFEWLKVSLKVIRQSVSVLRNSSVTFKFNCSWIATSWSESQMTKSGKRTNSDYAELRPGLDLGDAKPKSIVG